MGEKMRQTQQIQLILPCFLFWHLKNVLSKQFGLNGIACAGELLPFNLHVGAFVLGRETTLGDHLVWERLAAQCENASDQGPLEASVRLSLRSA